ncbi:MAG: glycosyltransferase family 2 protein [Candidatus Pacebacteria bacterium]|jgi:teichuronic acid biosynthesis glycosyltransferase TuaG|nr:glycosyltransferase family 2 protein [Candidatus Paceibacterota bacterium]
MKNLVSVIIPTWNREETLIKAIQSVQNQTHKDLEILVCDDGSTDNTKKLVSRIISKDSRVKWIAGKHSGRPAIPRNNGLKNSRGNWIAFLDSDDKWDKNKLTKQLNYAKKNNCEAICTNAERILDNQNTGSYLSIFQKKRFTIFDLIKSNHVICSSVLVKKQLIIEAGQFPEEEKFTAIEDYVLWLRVATTTDFSFINENLVDYSDEPQKSIRSVRDSNGIHPVLINNIFWQIRNFNSRSIWILIKLIIQLIK